MDNGIAALFIPFGRLLSLASPLSATLYPNRSTISPLNRRILHLAPHSKPFNINDIWALRLAVFL
jgi:hypothetical protein